MSLPPTTVFARPRSGPRRVPYSVRYSMAIDFLVFRRPTKARPKGRLTQGLTTERRRPE